LVDRIDFVAGLKVNYVVPETFPYRDPLGAEIIKDIHGCSSMFIVMSSAQRSRGGVQVECAAHQCVLSRSGDKPPFDPA
jgi:hypothetical protein